MPNPLDPVLLSYETAVDSMRVALRVIEKGIPGIVLRKHVSLSNLSAQELKDRIELARGELDRLAIVAMTAIFERTLRDHLVRAAGQFLPPDDSRFVGWTAIAERDIERWGLPDRVLEMYAAVDADLKGRVRQVIHIRNLVAHGRAVVNPGTIMLAPVGAYRILSEFLIRAGVVETSE